MKFGIAFSSVGPFVQPDALADFAVTAEKVGVESLWSVEHVAVPVEYTSVYPYHASGRVAHGVSETDIPDPLLPLSYMAAHTSTIKLGTGILVLPQRHPIYVAKELATLDVLSKGRLICGIGMNWMREEYEALGIDFDTRAARCRDSVAAIRTLWKPEPEAFESEHFNWPALHSHPKPVQKDGIPFFVGGATPIAAKRAARYCDGFFPPISDPKKLAILLDVMREECDKKGRDFNKIQIMAGDAMAPPPSMDVIAELADLGVTRVIVPPPGVTPEGGTIESVRDGLQEFSENYLQKF